jgi:anaerobic selenocysteine-containing dehydrogenase
MAYHASTMSHAPDVQRSVTFCRICEASCGVVAEHEGDRLLALRPDPAHVVSRGYACKKGLAYTDVHNSADRVTRPLKRVGGAFEAISWEQALAEIGAKLRESLAAHGPDSAGVYIGNPVAFGVLHGVFAGNFMKALGGRHLYTSGSQDCNNKFVATEEMFGSPLLQPIPSLDAAQCAILVGTNPAVSQLSFVNAPRAMERLKQGVKRGGRVVFVNPRRTESADQLGEQCFIRPGTDVYFFLSFAQVAFGARRPSAALLAASSGFEALLQAVQPFTPERTEAITGIAASALRALVQAYLAAESAFLYAGTGVNQGPHGTLCQWLLIAISLVSGHFDRPGCLVVTPQQRRTAKMGAPHGAALKHHVTRAGGLRSVLDSLPAGLMPDEILEPGPGQLRALFVSAGNPVLSCANGARMEAALRSLPLLVCIDMFRNETGNLAHYILPATSFLERADMPLGCAGFQPIPYAQLTPAVFAPRGECREEWWIYTRIAKAAGLRLGKSRLFQRLAQRAAQGPSAQRWRLPTLSPQLLFSMIALGAGLLPGTLRKHPHGLLLPPMRHGRFLREGVLTTDRRIVLAPVRLLGALSALEAALAAPPAQGALQLITKRERHSHNSWMHNRPVDRHERLSRQRLHMHPDDAAARGLCAGQLCEVRSATGSVQVELALSDALMPGAVALPHGHGHAAASGLTLAQQRPGVNVNLLAADGAQAVEQLSGMARLTAIAVEVSAVS